jgi:hypothetical protein
MAIDFGLEVYAANYAVWARPIMVIPIASQPGMPSFDGRGIFHTGPVNVLLEDGSILSDQRTTLDVLEAEFGVLPGQRDIIRIPVDPDSGLPALGDFVVSDTSSNGGGETTLTLNKLKIPILVVQP